MVLHDRLRRTPGLRRKFAVSVNHLKHVMGTVLTVTQPQCKSDDFTRIILEPD